MAQIQILIQNGSAIMEPAVLEDVQWTTQRKGTPGKLTFTAMYDEQLNVQEGNPVQFNVDGEKVFYGYVFEKSRDRDMKISFTCYDQLRYFKNKDTYVEEGKTASQILKMICSDFFLSAGIIEDTGYIIPKMKESNKTLFDIVQNALDTTMLNTRKVYVLYDNYGKITLQNIASMKIPLLIDEETAQNFSYTSSIDKNTYDQVKLVQDDSKSGTRKVWLAKDSANINQWGLLQYFDTLNEGEVGQQKAEQLLAAYNKKTRNLSINDAFGYIGLRAGFSPLVKLDLGDLQVFNYMVADKVTHKFKNGEHTMDLTLTGGEFIA